MRESSQLNYPPRVALLVETSTAYGRGILRGIHCYIREYGPWSVYLREQERGDTFVPPLSLGWHGDGIIARVDNHRLAEQLNARRDTPIVDVCANRMLPWATCVETDDKAIAKIATTHLLDRNFQHFAYCGDDRFHWAIERGRYFAQLINKEGHSCITYQWGSHEEKHSEKIEKKIANWVTQLPKPVGVMACHDFRGWQILEVCRKVGIMVPDEVAVLGVDNDELLCELSDPPLTSVACDAFRTGYEAAKMLDRWMKGERPNHDLQIEPHGIITRKSTDAFAVADPILSQAVRFIREHACDGIRVHDILKQVPISRATLDSEFKKILGRTPHEEIQRVQFQRVIELLTKTKLSLANIAERAGFKHPEYLTYSFKQHFDMPPSEYREKHQDSRIP